MTADMGWVGEAFIQAIGVFGGMAAAAALLSGYVGRIVSNQITERLRGELARELETHRIRLKKSEALFLEELEATKLLSFFRNSLTPIYRHPLMDWHESCGEIAVNFGAHEKHIDKFLAAFGWVMSEKAVSLLTSASAIAGEYKFEAISDEEDISVSDEARKAAAEFFNNIKEAEDELRSNIRAQVIV